MYQGLLDLKYREYIELTPKGNRAYFSTYLGGEHDDVANAVALGGSGDVYAAGSMNSPKFPCA